MLYVVSLLYKLIDLCEHIDCDRIGASWSIISVLNIGAPVAIEKLVTTCGNIGLVRVRSSFNGAFRNEDH